MRIRNPQMPVSKEGIRAYLYQHLAEFGRLWVMFNVRNWFITPITSLRLLSILLLSTIIHWPGWLVNVLPKTTKIDLNDAVTRKYYYITYMVVTGISGSILMFFYS